MSRLIRLGIALVVCGVASGALEQAFYGGRVGADGVLQESFFLPLAFILVFLGGGLIVAAAVRYLLTRGRRPGR